MRERGPRRGARRAARATGRGPRIWTEDHVRAELRAFLGSRPDWPRAAEFAAAGRSVLRRMVARYGGRERWARELGVVLSPRPQRAPVWDEARIGRELSVLLAERRAWPTATEFQLAGAGPLWEAIKRDGGVDRWAFEFGLRRQSRRSGSRRAWTEQRIENELRRFLHGREAWPSADEFAAAGKASLFTAAYRYGGLDHWAGRLGLPRPAPRRRSAPHWSEERIASELADFCQGRQVWPRQADFSSAGRLPLYWAASRAGGMRRWQAALGFAADRDEGRARRAA